MTDVFPSPDESVYLDWTPPEHEHTFVDDNTVEVGVLEGEKMVVYQIKLCTQCDENVYVKTNRTPSDPRK